MFRIVRKVFFLSLWKMLSFVKIQKALFLQSQKTEIKKEMDFSS
jgi:hypothetical protein